MARIVMKFGGTSVADIARIRNVAQHVKREVDAGHEVAVVVSAMAGKTNELVGWAREAAPLHDAREYDAVVASGEQVTAGLLAIAAAIKADRCDIYTDVDGVYTTDPRVVPKAQRLEKVAFEEMLEMASLGAKVMQVRSIELGMVHNVRIFVRSSFDKPEDIDPHSNQPPGTM